MQQTRKLPETFTGANDGVEIRIQELSVRFPDKSGSAVDALTHVNLEIRQGEFLSLVGPSGCGKTTLLRAIADLQQPTEGSITVRGQTPREIRLQKKFGIVFQNPVLYDWRTARRNVCMPMELMGIPKKQRTETVSEMLDMVNLLGAGYKYPHQMSGGMQQRVGIARALAIKPEILLMDEPFSALDAVTRLQLQDLACELLADKTVLLITHDPQEAIRLADRIYTLTDPSQPLAEPLFPQGQKPRCLTQNNQSVLQQKLFARLLHTDNSVSKDSGNKGFGGKDELA